MAQKQLKTRMIMKHDTEANWTTAGNKNFVPLKGEIIIYDKDANHNYTRVKIGDGATNVSALPFIDANKVDKVSGKGLSTNDYTTAEKNKLAGIAEGANKTVIDTAMSSSSTNPVQNKIVNAAIANAVSNGTAAKAGKLATARTISLTGSTTGSIAFDGSSDIAINNETKYLKLKSVNPITDVASDTVDIWRNQGISLHYFNSPGQVIDKPSTYGLLMNFGDINKEIHQLWMAQSSGTIYHRGGNGSGWGSSWQALLDNANYTNYTVKKDGTGASGTWGINIIGNAASSDKWANKRNLTIGNSTQQIDGSANISYSHANIGADVSTSWTNGTSAGPVLNVSVNGVSKTAAIPVASTSASGVVSTGVQRFKGRKTLEYPKISSNNNKYLGFDYVTTNDTKVAEHYYTTGDKTNVTAGQFTWMQHCPNSPATTSPSEFKEYFSLPAATAGRTDNGNYEILTTKNYALLDNRYLGKTSSATSANKVNHSLSFNVNGTTTSFDGSSDKSITINAAALGIPSVMNFLGTTTTAISDGATTTSIKIGETTVTAKKGDVVLYSNKEFVFNGSAWELFGDEGSYALKTVSITAGNGLTGGGTLASNRTLAVGQGSGITVTADAVAHADTSSQASISAASRTYISGVTLDGFGHVTGLTTGTETVTDTHHTAKNIMGSSATAIENVTAATNNPYLNLVENGAVRSSFRISGSGSTTVKTDASGNITISSSSGSNTAHAHSAGTGLTITGSGGTSGTTTYSANLNSTTSLGTIGTTSKLYAVGVDANGKLCVNVPWTDNNTTYTFTNAGATLAWNTSTKIATVGGTDITVKLPANPNTNTAHSHDAGTGLTVSGSGGTSGTTTYSLNLSSDTSLGTIGTTSKLYAVGVDENGELCVNVPWENTTYSFSNKAATLSWGATTTIATVGGTNITVKMPANPNSNTAHSHTAGTGLTISGSGGTSGTTTYSANLNSTSSLGTIGTTSKLYAVGVDANGKLCVNVPWTDTNTTYSFTNKGATLSWGTTSTIATVGGTDITVKMPAKPTDTTYTFTNNAPTLAWGTTSTIGTVGGVDLTVKMPANPNTNTTYSAGTGLDLSGTTFNHSNSITAGSVGSAQTPTNGGTFAIPKITYDAQGHITGATTVNVTLPTIAEAPELDTLSINGKTYDGSSAVTVGTIGIAYGGTGATTASAARTNLGIIASGSAPSSPSTGTIWLVI